MRGMQKLREETGLTYRELCRLTKLPYSTLMRWRGRRRRNRELIGTPGPKKLLLPDWEGLNWEIARLCHGRRRSAGTGALCRKYRSRISRRALREKVAECRRELHRSRRRKMKRLRWLVPGAVWAMDDTLEPKMGEIHLVQDAASRYKLSVQPAPTLMKGNKVAENLEKLIERYGPPLALKRDNGGNLNHKEVEEVLWRNLIIPLNSPPHYPRYNGQVERGQREISEAVKSLPAAATASPRQHEVQARLIAQEINHRPRPCLEGQTACAVFFAGNARVKAYNRTRRKRAYREVLRLYTENLVGLAVRSRRGIKAAWRQAVETWLIQEGIIAVEKRKSVTPFSSNLVS